MEEANPPEPRRRRPSGGSEVEAHTPQDFEEEDRLRGRMSSEDITEVGILARGREGLVYTDQDTYDNRGEDIRDRDTQKQDRRDFDT